MRASARSASAPNTSPRSISARAIPGISRSRRCRARPGRATRVIITEWDLPRPTIEPHDVVVDKEGIAWYSNFGEQTFGKFDPKTGKHTECPVPELKKGWPTGMLGLRADRDGNMWLGMMYQGAIAQVRSEDREGSPISACRRR